MEVRIIVIIPLSHQILTLALWKGRALAEVIFGAVNPSGKLSVSTPRHVGTTPVFHNYLKGGRQTDNPGAILDDGTLQFGNQVSEVCLIVFPISDICQVRSRQPYSTLEFRTWS
jgi:hypothetical protein